MVALVRPTAYCGESQLNWWPWKGDCLEEQRSGDLLYPPASPGETCQGDRSSVQPSVQPFSSPQIEVTRAAVEEFSQEVIKAGGSEIQSPRATHGFLDQKEVPYGQSRPLLGTGGRRLTQGLLLEQFPALSQKASLLLPFHAPREQRDVFPL